jgi:hypothetical protein
MKTALTVSIMLVLALGWGCKGTAQGSSAPSDRKAEAAASEQTTELTAQDTPERGQEAQEVAVPGRSEARPGPSPAYVSKTGEEATGPTVRLSYGQGTSETNPMHDFMYFIPLISPVPMRRAISANNGQQVAIVCYERKVSARSFCVTCEFEMTGDGSIRYTFDSDQMIARRIAELKKSKGEPLANVLDYIDFEGDGFGCIQVKGTVADGTPTVTDVHLEFNARGRRSPVTIGLYDLKAKNSQYSYANRSNQVIARVNSLAFEKSDDPRMDLSVASITKKPGSNGFFGHLKAAIANLFIKPVRINPCGNQTLLDFGGALLEQKTAFTFPKAANLREITVFAAGNKAK